MLPEVARVLLFECPRRPMLPPYLPGWSRETQRCDDLRCSPAELRLLRDAVQQELVDRLEVVQVVPEPCFRGPRGAAGDETRRAPLLETVERPVVVEIDCRLPPEGPSASVGQRHVAGVVEAEVGLRNRVIVLRIARFAGLIEADNRVRRVRLIR